MLKKQLSRWVFAGAVLPVVLVILVFSAFFVSCGKPFKTTPSESEAGKLIVGYVFGWNQPMEPKKIPAHFLTHINYAFALIEDGRVVPGRKDDGEKLLRLGELKKRNPDLKLLISVGGWTGSGGFSDMALTAASRRVFIDSAVAFMKTYRLDGVDLDWEYPGLPGYGNTHRPEDKENFTALLREMRQRFDVLGKVDNRYYLLTIAAGANTAYLEHAEMGKLHVYLDFVNLMTYDFVGEWQPFTGHHSCLYNSSPQPGAISTDGTVKRYIAAGVPVEKMNLGVPFYGRGFENVGEGNNGLYRTGKGMKGDFRYRSLLKSYINKNGFRRFWDETARVPYLWNGKTRQFITYEDPVSLKGKCRYVRQKGLAGVMFWQFYEDHENKLLQTIYDNVR